MMSMTISIATDPLVAGIMWTEKNRPDMDHVEYHFTKEQLEAMQCEYATGALAEMIHDYLVRKGAYIK